MTRCYKKESDALGELRLIRMHLRRLGRDAI